MAAMERSNAWRKPSSLPGWTTSVVGGMEYSYQVEAVSETAPAIQHEQLRHGSLHLADHTAVIIR
jgi:hypothetical protein